MRRKPNSMSKGTVSPHGCCLCLPSCLLRDLRGAKTPFLLFPSKTRKVDVQIRKGTKIQKWPHGTTGEGVLYAFIFSCMNWAQSPLTQSLSCLGKVGVPPPHFAMPCPEEIGRYEIRTLEILALYTAPVYRYRSASPSEVRQVTIMGGSLCYIEMGADLRGT